jgi:hypothetical protein
MISEQQKPGFSPPHWVQGQKTGDISCSLIQEVQQSAQRVADRLMPDRFAISRKSHHFSPGFLITD